MESGVFESQLFPITKFTPEIFFFFFLQCQNARSFFRSILGQKMQINLCWRKEGNQRSSKKVFSTLICMYSLLANFLDVMKFYDSLALSLLSNFCINWEADVLSGLLLQILQIFLRSVETFHFNQLILRLLNVFNDDCHLCPPFSIYCKQRKLSMATRFYNPWIFLQTSALFLHNPFKSQFDHVHPHSYIHGYYDLLSPQQVHSQKSPFSFLSFFSSCRANPI